MVVKQTSPKLNPPNKIMEEFIFHLLIHFAYDALKWIVKKIF